MERFHRKNKINDSVTRLHKMPNKRILSVVKAWEKLVESKEFEDLDTIEIDEDLRICFELEEYSCVSEYLSELIKFVDPDRFIKVLTCDVAKKAAINEFCATSLIVEDPRTGFPSYLEAPEGLRESYLLHPLRWMNAFVSVRYAYVSMIPIGVFFPEIDHGLRRPWYELGKVIDFDRLSAKLLEMNPSDDDERWKNFLSEIDDDDTNDCNELIRRFHLEIERYTKVPLRVIFYEEKVFRDLEDPEFKAPRRFKIIEMIPGIRFMINYWIMGLECDTPILDALLNTRAFDLKIE